ncbi:hypothetical protein IPM09_05475 [Candidatus Saccharibacteria bacterium]|nr:MAG: hypothetical protein IPM09_05475 [Candidatus Saccharibacteria bacterium]
MPKATVTAKSSPQTQWFVRHKVAIIIIVTALLIDIFFTGFIKFGYSVVRCGGMPVLVTRGGFWGGRASYWLPGRYTPGGIRRVFLQ